MKLHLKVENFGPIRTADVEFGDLTVLVGPQASGKSLFVQLLKAVRDAGAIRSDLRDYGFEGAEGADALQVYCSAYFGAGSENIAHHTSIQLNGEQVQFSNIVRPGLTVTKAESTFFIPAQRVLQDSWPKPFRTCSEDDPYCMRHFSDMLGIQGLLPSSRRHQPKRFKAEPSINDAIFAGAKPQLDNLGTQKRILSTGQRDFTSLLLGLYWLTSTTKASRCKEIDTVIIEEPERGLHPQSIMSFGLLVLELLQWGYRVIISTHSPVILDLVWAIRQLKNIQPKMAINALRDIFGLKRSGQMKAVFQASLTKNYLTYFFERRLDGVVVRDISSLDPGDDDEAVSGWGGLSGFSGNTTKIAGDAICDDLFSKVREHNKKFFLMGTT
jgi:hypothetical protein